MWRCFFFSLALQDDFGRLEERTTSVRLYLVRVTLRGDDSQIESSSLGSSVTWSVVFYIFEVEVFFRKEFYLCPRRFVIGYFWAGALSE